VGMCACRPAGRALRGREGASYLAGEAGIERWRKGRGRQGGRDKQQPHLRSVCTEGGKDVGRESKRGQTAHLKVGLQGLDARLVICFDGGAKIGLARAARLRGTQLRFGDINLPFLRVKVQVRAMPRKQRDVCAHERGRGRGRGRGREGEGEEEEECKRMRARRGPGAEGNIHIV